MQKRSYLNRAVQILMASGALLLIGPGRSYAREIATVCNSTSNVTLGPNGVLYGVVQGFSAQEYTPCSTSANGFVYSLTPDKVNQRYIFKDLHDFAGSPNDGADPIGAVVVDGAGNVYGTTWAGGQFGQTYGGEGTVYKLAPDGTITLLHSFNGADGSNPDYRLLLDNARGLLFGVTLNSPTLYAVGIDGRRFQVLAPFTSCDFNGCGDPPGFPSGGVVEDQSGVLYGLTEGDVFTGTPGGSLYKIAPGGPLVTLHVFPGGAGGGYSPQGLALDGQGNIFGTTDRGASCNFDTGTVFKFVLSSNTFSSFDLGCNGGSAAEPVGDVALDARGSLWMTDELQGVFRWSPDNTLTLFPEDDPQINGQGVILNADDSILYNAGSDFQNPPQGIVYGLQIMP